MARTRYTKARIPNRMAFFYATRLCITTCNSFGGFLASKWPIIVSKLDFSPPPSFLKFFLLPLAVRQQIYFHVLRNAYFSLLPEHLQSTSSFKYDLPPVDLPFVYSILGVPTPSKFSTLNIFSNLLPISRQWHTEIEEVVFSRFRIRLRESLLALKRERDGFWCLDFLPERGVHFIQRLEVHVYLYLDKNRDIIRYDPGTIIKGCKDLSTHLPSLKRVDVMITPRFSETEHSGPRPCFQTKEDLRRVRDFILVVCRPFLREGVELTVNCHGGKCRDRGCWNNARIQGRNHADLNGILRQISPGGPGSVLTKEAMDLMPRYRRYWGRDFVDPTTRVYYRSFQYRSISSRQTKGLS